MYDFKSSNDIIKECKQKEAEVHFDIIRMCNIITKDMKENGTKYEVKVGCDTFELLYLEWSPGHFMAVVNEYTECIGNTYIDGEHIDFIYKDIL